MTAQPQPASHLRAVIRTTDLYIDRSELKVVCQVHDVYRNVRIQTTGLTIRLTITSAAVQVSPIVQAFQGPLVSLGISVSPTGSGIGHFSVQIPNEYFLTTADVSLSIQASVFYEGNEAAAYTASAGVATCHSVPFWWGVTSQVTDQTGMFVLLPASPVFLGEEFSFSIYANTTNAPLVSQHWKVDFNSSAGIGYSTSASECYRSDQTCVVPNHLYTPTLSFSATSFQFLSVGVLNDAASYALVTGPAIHLATVTLRVTASSVVGVCASCIRLTILSMINSFGRTYVTGPVPGTVLGIEDVRAAIPSHAPPPSKAKLIRVVPCDRLIY